MSKLWGIKGKLWRVKGKLLRIMGGKGGCVGAGGGPPCCIQRQFQKFGLKFQFFVTFGATGIGLLAEIPRNCRNVLIVRRRVSITCRTDPEATVPSSQIPSLRSWFDDTIAKLVSVSCSKIRLQSNCVAMGYPCTMICDWCGTSGGSSVCWCPMVQ